MLCFNPAKRISVDAALNHPYFAALKHKGQLKTRPPINSLEFEFENYNLTMQQLKGMTLTMQILYTNKFFFITALHSPSLTEKQYKTIKAHWASCSATRIQNSLTKVPIMTMIEYIFVYSNLFNNFWNIIFVWDAGKIQIKKTTNNNLLSIKHRKHK